MNLKKLISRKIFKVVSEAANELQYETYVVGGYVRDVLDFIVGAGFVNEHMISL